MAYIYIIKNHINDKCYIGLTNRSIEIRFKEHLKLLKSNEKQLIHKAIKKYGKENFYVELLEECDETVVNEREKHYISIYDSINSGYNILRGGRGYSPLSKCIEESTVKDLCKDYQAGASLRDLQIKYSLQRKKISNILKENNINIRPKVSKILKPKILKFDIVLELLKKSKSYAEIGRFFNVSESSVRKFVKNYNLKNIIQNMDRDND